MKRWLRAARVHQWSKNGLLLLPAVAAHSTPNVSLALTLLLAFASFSLLASAVYLVNDLVDLEHDRQHPTKRHRPIAAGEIDHRTVRFIAPLLAVVALGLALQLPIGFLQAWAAYLVITTAYSFSFKRVVVLDVVVLAALYTVRVVAGAAAAEVELSRWFLAFGVFFFLSLALLKRLVEIRGLSEREATVAAGRGWAVADLPILMNLGIASALAAALVYCLYITSSDVLASDPLTALYSHPDRLWLGLPVFLYWLARVWLLGHRGEVHDDPVVFALTDRASYAVLAALIFVLWIAA